MKTNTSYFQISTPTLANQSKENQTKISKYKIQTPRLQKIYI